MNRLQQIEIDFQREYTSFIARMALDIRSPLMSLEKFIKNCSFPEREVFEKSINSLRNVANDLLNKYEYTKRKLKSLNSNEGFIFIAISDAMTLIKLRYKENSASIGFFCDPQAKFTFVRANLSNIIREFSNLIDKIFKTSNEKKAAVYIKLSSDKKEVLVIIENKSVKINELENSLKKEEEELELAQIANRIQQNGGRLISSKEEERAKFTILLPVADLPQWIVTKIDLHPRYSFLIILDSDSSIRNFWNKLLAKNDIGIEICFFVNMDDMTNFLDSLPQEKREKTFIFIGEYTNENLCEKISVILRNNIARSLVVTSIPNDPQLQKFIKESGVKMCPREFLEKISISEK